LFLSRPRIKPYTARTVRTTFAILAALALASCAPYNTMVAPATPSPEAYATQRHGQVSALEAIVRQSPGIEAPEVARLSQGTIVTVLACQGKWVQIEEPSGWVYADLLNISQIPPTLTPTISPSHTPVPTLCPTVRPSPTKSSASEVSTLPSPSPVPTPVLLSTIAPPTLTSTPSYPAIVLVEPADGVTIQEHSWVRWQWAGTLNGKHCFLIQFQQVENPAMSGFRVSRETEYHLELWKWPKGSYAWSVALASGCDPQTLESNTILLQSEKRVFIQEFLPPPLPPSTPMPTPTSRPTPPP